MARRHRPAGLAALGAAACIALCQPLAAAPVPAECTAGAASAPQPCPSSPEEAIELPDESIAALRALYHAQAELIRAQEAAVQAEAELAYAWEMLLQAERLPDAQFASRLRLGVTRRRIALDEALARRDAALLARDIARVAFYKSLPLKAQ